jgi:Magnesium chelatase, subunit ChlI C-terminal
MAADSYDRILKVSRTIANLADSDEIRSDHVLTLSRLESSGHSRPAVVANRIKSNRCGALPLTGAAAYDKNRQKLFRLLDDSLFFKGTEKIS